MALSDVFYLLLGSSIDKIASRAYLVRLKDRVKVLSIVHRGPP